MLAQHPRREDIRLDHVLTALSNPVRLAVLCVLAREGESLCCAVLPQIRKSTMTHHFRILRDSGVVWQRHVGREYRLSLRREDLAARFPGLLDAVLETLEKDPLTAAILSSHLQSNDVAPPDA